LLMYSCAKTNAGPPVDYLKGRGITDVPANVMLLSTKGIVRRLTGRAYPAMIAPIMRGEGEMQGAALLLLSADAQTKLAVTDGRPRRIYGELKNGFVPLGQVHPDKPVIVAEGIETALSVRQVTNLPALACLSAGNMAALPMPDCSEVIIAADNDLSGTGLKAAETLAERLSASGKRVRIALPDRPEDDWNNVLVAANNNEDMLSVMRHAILQAKPFEPSQSNVERYALSMEDVINLEVPPRQYLLEPWLETGSTAMIFGRRGSFKTRFAMSVGYAIATSRELLGWKVHKAAGVLYIDGELPTALLQKRLQLLGPLTENFKLVARDILLRQYGKGLPDLGAPEGREFLDKIIEAEQSELVIIDSLSTTIRSGIENEAESWAPIQDWIMQHRFRGRTLVFLHHEGKNNQQRGTSKREDMLDTIIRLKERKDLETETECACELSFEKSREFYGAEAEPLILRLAKTAATSRRESVKDNLKEKIRELSEQGNLKQSEIGKELGLTQGWVSKVLKQLAAEKIPRETTQESDEADRSAQSEGRLL
jgi:putative DNA primase/helicase